jgi:hypothetical protein
MASMTKRTKTPASTTAGDAERKAPSSGDAPSAASIAARAYELWRQSGCTHGNDQAHWFQAERELRGRSVLR